MVSKQIHTKGYAIVPPLLCMNQEYISDLKSERLPLFWCAVILFTSTFERTDTNFKLELKLI